jgi:uncharacterized protein YaeQ
VSDSDAIPRQQSERMALRQIGWLGHTGQYYPLGAGPTSNDEPGGFSPVYIQIGTWVELELGHWAIED